MSPGTRPATVRFYLDADLLGLAKVLGPLRADITYPGDPGAVVHKRQRPPCPITDRAMLDAVWIPQVAAHNWIIVTRDSRIQLRPAEVAAVRDHGARMVALGGDDARTVWAQLELFMTQWRRIEHCLEEDGPFIYTATRHVFRRVL